MQKLHLVGFTTELDGLILSARKGAKSGGYVIALDDRILASIDEAHRRRNGPPAELAPGEPVAARNERNATPTPPKPTSALSPREIQARLRAGASVSEIAAVAGVDDEWVLRFATPIRAEQARVVDRALRLSFAKARLGLSSLPLGESVKANLTERGVRLHDDIFDAGWSAYNLHGTTWAVRFGFVNRSRARAAVWQVDLREGEVTSRGRLAGELGYVEPGRRPPRPESLETPAPATVAAPRTGTGGPVSAPPAAAKAAAPAAVVSKGGAVAAKRAEATARADDERPTHLARPLSPMSSTNRAPVQPGRMAGAPSLRSQAPSPRQPPSPVAAASPRRTEAPAKPAKPAAEAFVPKPPPARPSRAAAPSRAKRSAPVRPVPTIPTMTIPSVVEVTPGAPEPAVVVLPASPRQRRGRTRDR